MMTQEHSFATAVSRRTVLKRGLHGALAMSFPSAFWGLGCSKKGKNPNIILMTMDTTRADHLSCYGYYRTTTPNLDRLANESVMYTRAIATSSWTLPSHASLFTGKFTSSHGAEFDPNGPLKILDAIDGPDAWNKYRARGLSPEQVTLAMILKNYGYQTGAVVGGPWMKAIFGLAKGFDFYDDSQIGALNGRLAHQVTASAVDWIKKVNGSKFFLFLNYFDPHSPYKPPREFVKPFLSPATFQNPQALSDEERHQLNLSFYDGEILFMDYYIGHLIKTLKDSGLYDNTLIVITADHGELFGEHDKTGHGESLYQEEIHVPLLFKYPGTDMPQKQSDSMVQLNDIMTMILRYIDADIPENIQSGFPPDLGHPVMSEVYPLPVISKDGSWRALFDDHYKFLWNSEGRHRLYNLKDDADEQINLAEKDPALARKMMAQLDGYIAGLPKPAPMGAETSVDEETQKALKSLGYVK